MTDVETYEDSYLPYSKPQTLFKVGALDLNANQFRVVTFGKDIAKALLKAGLPPPAWKSPLTFPATILRASHGNDAKGRFVTTATLDTLDPALLALAPSARKLFVGEVSPNLQPGSWDPLVERAARENRIERAALAMVGSFAAGDVVAITGDRLAHVGGVLKSLVGEGKLLPPTGTKRWARYQVAPLPITERADWSG